MSTAEITNIETLIAQLKNAVRQMPGEDRFQFASRLAALAEQLGAPNHALIAQKSEERFRSVLDYSQDVVYRRNLQDDCYDYMSASSAQILTFTPDEMRAMPISEVIAHIHPEDRQLVEDGIAASDLSGSGRLEYRWLGKDGRYHWLADYVSVQKDEAGQPLYRGGILRDITAQKEAAEALRQSEARLRLVLETSSITVFAHDRDLRYLWVFNFFLKLPVKQILGRRDDEILPYEDVAELVAVKQSVLDTGQPVHREVHLLVDGEDHWRIVTAEPVRDENGTITGVHGAGMDITDLRRLQLENQESSISMEVQHRLMEYREQERQQIARELHDGPIQTLVSELFHLQMLMDDSTDPRIANEYEEIVQGLKTTVRNLRETVNELRPPSLSHFGLTKVIQVHSMDFQDRHPEMKLRLYLFDDQNRVDDQTSLALFRIYQEGLNNAVLHARAARVEVTYRVQDDQLVLELRDNGQGFEVPGDLREMTRGGHFGLAGMEERARAVGGQIQIVSALGGGTILRATVPYRDKCAGAT